MDSKVKAARMLRTWVQERRSSVQMQMGAAARDAQEGGSTLQDLPEMMVPYGLYILARHPDFPQVWPWVRPASILVWKMSVVVLMRKPI
jgi:hypothetical protein